MKKKVLFTGANGFIGKNIVPLLQKSYTVFTPSRNRLDLQNTTAVERYVRRNNIHTIIHAANVGGTRDTVQNQQTLLQNTRMFFNLARLLPHISKLITFGSGAEYDKSRPLKYVQETEFGKHIPTDEYGLGKYICSSYSEALLSKKLVCLRLFGIYGPHEPYLVKFISNTIVKTLFRQPITIMQNAYFDYLYVTDLYPVVQYFLGHTANHVSYHVVSAARVSLVQIARMVALQNTGTKHYPISIVNKGLNNEYTASNKRLLTEHPFAFTPLQTGIRLLSQWYQNNQNTLDKQAIIKDRYAQFCTIKQ